MRALLRLLTVTGLSLATACGSLTGQISGREPTDSDCRWEQERGVAELVAMDNGQATFAFHPGNTTVFMDANAQWSVGDEFKAILETPVPSECGDPRLKALQPLTPTD